MQKESLPKEINSLKSVFDKTTKSGRQNRAFFQIIILLAGMLTAGGGYFILQKQSIHSTYEEAKVFESSSVETTEDNTEMNQTEEESFSENKLYVHICGEVKQPGVYLLGEGARIFDVVKAAGGFTEEACQEAVNLARIVADGEQIKIPNKEEGETFFEVSSQADSGKINLNTATKEQLMTLSGIGESRAEAILSYREEQGKFNQIEDIMNVPGIKEAAFKKIEKEIIVK